MKRCPKCDLVVPDDAPPYCRADGTMLVYESGEVSDGAETRVFPTAQGADTSETRILPTGEAAGRLTAPTTVLDARPASGNTQELRKSKSRRGVIVVAAAVVAIALAASAYIYLSDSNSSTAKNSIAVLPFQNASDDPDVEYLSDGISESLINSLSQLQNVRVLARSTMFSFKGKESNPQEVGRQLGVETVLTGRVVQRGDSLTVQADLVNVANGSQIWGERYSRKVSDLLAVQEDIAREISEKLRQRLSGEERGRVTKRYTDDFEAYQAYLRGRHEWNKRTADGLNRAIGYFNQAIEKDPAYALAYTGAADSYALVPAYTNTPLEESLAKAKAAALRALEIDDSLAEAHVSLANVKASMWDWDGVEDGYRRGLSLNPNYATGHQWYSEYLLHVGRLDEAVKEARLAQQLDPLSLIINTHVGLTLYDSRRYDEAAAQLRKTLEFDPEFVLTNIFLYYSLRMKGAHQESIPHLVKGFFNDYPPGEKAQIESSLQSAFAASGERGIQEKLLDVLRHAEKRNYTYPAAMAGALIELGEKDEAFVWLNRAADVKHPAILTLKVDPIYDPLRSDPRFAELVRRVGLPQ